MSETRNENVRRVACVGSDKTGSCCSRMCAAQRPNLAFQALQGVHGCAPSVRTASATQVHCRPGCPRRWRADFRFRQGGRYQIAGVDARSYTDMEEMQQVDGGGTAPPPNERTRAENLGLADAKTANFL